MPEAIETGITIVLMAIWVWLCFLIGITLITVCLVLWSIEKIKKLFKHKNKLHTECIIGGLISKGGLNSKPSTNRPQTPPPAQTPTKLRRPRCPKK